MASTVRSTLVAGLVGLLVGLALTGWVWWDMRGTRLAAEEERAAAVETERAERAALESRIQGLEASHGLLLARVLVARATIALDQRNFGTANEALDAAASRLDAVDAARAGVDAERLGRLKADLRGLAVEVAQDLEAQRRALLDVAVRLDRLLDARNDAH